MLPSHSEVFKVECLTTWHDLIPMTFRARLTLSKSSIVAMCHNLHQGRLNEMHYKRPVPHLFQRLLDSSVMAEDRPALRRTGGMIHTAFFGE